MKSELGHGIGIALFVLATAAAAENVFQPGVRHVCVPNADHSGWDCGTVDKPPPGYRKPAAEGADNPAITDPKASAARPNQNVAPTTRADTSPAQPAPAQEASRVSPPPPPFLANPNRPRFPLSAPQPTPRPAPQPDRVADSPVVATAPAPVPQPATPVDARSSAASSQTAAAAVTVVAEPTATAGSPAPTLAADAEPASVAELSAVKVAPQPAVAPLATVTRTAIASDRTATPVSATTAPSAAVRRESRPARPLLAALPGARAFAALSAGHYTLQLTGAASAVAFPELIERLAIDYRHCYVLRVDRDGDDWWLLVYGDFTDLTTAHAAARNLPRDPALAAVWPRRVGFLQAEFVPDHLQGYP